MDFPGIRSCATINKVEGSTPSASSIVINCRIKETLVLEYLCSSDLSFFPKESFGKTVGKQADVFDFENLQNTQLQILSFRKNLKIDVTTLLII